MTEGVELKVKGMLGDIFVREAGSIGRCLEGFVISSSGSVVESCLTNSCI